MKKVLNTDVLKADILEGVTRNGVFIISERTLNLNDLLATAHDFLLGYDVHGELRKEIHDLFTLSTIGGARKAGERLGDDVYLGRASIVGDDFMEEAGLLWNESFHSFCNRMAPEGYHFGSSEGDGSCFGWWKSEEDENGGDEQ